MGEQMNITITKPRTKQVTHKATTPSTTRETSYLMATSTNDKRPRYGKCTCSIACLDYHIPLKDKLRHGVDFHLAQALQAHHKLLLIPSGSLVVLDADDTQAMKWCNEALLTTHHHKVRTTRGAHYYVRLQDTNIKIPHGLKIDVRKEHNGCVRVLEDVTSLQNTLSTLPLTPSSDVPALYVSIPKQATHKDDEARRERIIKATSQRDYAFLTHTRKLKGSYKSGSEEFAAIVTTAYHYYETPSSAFHAISKTKPFLARKRLEDRDDDYLLDDVTRIYAKLDSLHGERINLVEAHEAYTSKAQRRVLEALSSMMNVAGLRRHEHTQSLIFGVSVQSLANNLSTTKQNVAKHIRKLTNMGLIEVITNHYFEHAGSAKNRSRVYLIRVTSLPGTKNA